MKKIGVIGLGYVGIPFCLAASKAGFNVYGYDIDVAKINSIRNGNCLLTQWNTEFNRLFVGKENFSSDSDILEALDMIVICVPTPIDLNNRPILSFIESAMNKIIALKKLPKNLVLESTVSPGTTRSMVVKRILNERNIKIGSDIFICFSPEREDPGNEKFTNVQIPKLLGGFSNECLDSAFSFYASIFRHVVRASSLEAAEFTKLFENTFRAVNIAFVNEIRDLADNINLDVEEIIDMASTKPFGFTRFEPGVGVGGHCIPVDPYYLTDTARKSGVRLNISEWSLEYNKGIPETISVWILKQAQRVNISDIVIMGIGYKSGVDDIRNSPSIEIMEVLSNNIKVEFWDPLVKEVVINKKVKKCLKEVDFTSKDRVFVITGVSGLDKLKNTTHKGIILDARYRKKL